MDRFFDLTSSVEAIQKRHTYVDYDYLRFQACGQVYQRSAVPHCGHYVVLWFEQLFTGLGHKSMVVSDDHFGTRRHDTHRLPQNIDQIRSSEYHGISSRQE